MKSSFGVSAGPKETATNLNIPAATAARYDFAGVVAAHAVSVTPAAVSTLQLNITKLCNQACLHCHVDASPRRRESMSDAVLDQCLAVLRRYDNIKTLDVTGGAPELHPRFKDLVRVARGMGKQVIVRHNLTVARDPHPLTKADMSYLPAFFAEQKVEVVSSLPYYQHYFTDRQRGDGVFEKSIAGLKELCAVGYGQAGSGLLLHLVYNPVGPFLPAAQATLAADYKRELSSKYGISFNELYTITNMPIHRFKAQLVKMKGYEDYMEKLVAAFNPAAATGVMCRSMVSVSYDGKLYDCDFNQMLGLRLEQPNSDIFAFAEDALLKRQIRFASHCFGCTAGAGSSCGGTTA